jgi:hypothetical protein
MYLSFATKRLLGDIIYVQFIIGQQEFACRIESFGPLRITRGYEKEDFDSIVSTILETQRCETCYTTWFHHFDEEECQWTKWSEEYRSIHLLESLLTLANQSIKPGEKSKSFDETLYSLMTNSQRHFDINRYIKILKYYPKYEEGVGVFWPTINYRTRLFSIPYE